MCPHIPLNIITNVMLWTVDAAPGSRHVHFSSLISNFFPGVLLLAPMLHHPIYLFKFPLSEIEDNMIPLADTHSSIYLFFITFS